MIKLKTESLPQRCDICHQSDCFSPQTEICSRCASVELVLPLSYDSTITMEKRARQMIYYIFCSLGIIVGYIVWQGINYLYQIINSSATYMGILFNLICLNVGLLLGFILWKS